MNTDLIKVALRQRALYLPRACSHPSTLTPYTLSLVAELRQLGFTLGEEALWAVDGLDDDGREELLSTINDVMGTRLNWASLVRGWLVPTGETAWDHFITFLANAEKAAGGGQELKGTTLPCGHFIPEGTFPLERYTGCPFCGTPFQTADFVYRGQGNKLRFLTLWGDDDLQRFFADLLTSPVPLDATQRESLKTLLHHFLSQPDSTLEKTVVAALSPRSISQKETIMLVADELVATGRDTDAGQLFATPSDILRYLCYRQTGHVQVIRPATLIHIAGKNLQHEHTTDADREVRLAEEKAKLHLKYSRTWCRRVAKWLNSQAASAVSTDSLLESMHPKREMWVRFIRALRLAEYARKPGYEALATLLNRFHSGGYEVWQGRVDGFRLKNDADTTLRLLSQRPGAFARCLFATMLTFGPQRVLETFRSVAPKLPVRLLLTLGTQAQLYFDRNQSRVARTIGGVMKTLEPNPMLRHYTDAQLQQMANEVGQVYLHTMRQHFLAQAADSTPGATVYIDPQLYNIPVAVADRSDTVQDISAALQGTRFAIEGDNVRLFMQWGKDLPAQHLDMDLSCYILKEPAAETETTDGTKPAEPTVCSYFSLSVPGARHSGDIRQIPDLVGTAEYIELSLPDLVESGAKRVVFTCNAYSKGAISPNLMVGWMSAEKPMTVSDETGVAYDPSTVDHMVRISESNLSKGLIFGVLEVEQREITWLEMPFDGQTVMSISAQTVDTFLRRLKAKPTVGQTLSIRAEALGQTVTDSPDGADEAFTLQWAQNTARVSALLMA